MSDDVKSCSSCTFWSPNRIEVEQVDGGRYECFNETLGGLRTHGTFGCNQFLGADSTEMNVPNHTPNGTMDSPNPNPIDGPCEVLIVTYWKDQPWLEYALRSIAKHLSGFAGVTVASPKPVWDGDWLRHIPREWLEKMGRQLSIPLRVHYYDEVPGKGFLQHEAKMGEADSIVPPGTKYVMHMDADCIVKMPTTSQDYFWNDKPVYLYRTWESLSSPDPHDPTRKVVSDCMMWKGPTEAQLGYASDVYTMTRHPTVFPIEFYPLYRAHIEQRHRVGFEEYFLSSNQNSHPQDRMDFTAMGQFAWTHMREKFHWINVATEEYPADRLRAYWSHGGISPEVRAEIEQMIA